MDELTESKSPLSVDLDFFIDYSTVLYLSLQYDDRCSDIASVYLLGPHFRCAQMCPMTLAVCVNNMIFFL